MTDSDRTLLQWLAGRPPEALARILANRREAAAAPWPRHLPALAVRLADPSHTTIAIRRLPAPAAQALRALAALPPGATRGELAGMLGVDPTDEDLADALNLLAEHALAWDGPSGRILAAPGVSDGWHHPLGLGAPAADLLERTPFYKIKEIARRLGQSLGGGKAAVVARIIDFYQDDHALDAVLGSGPEGVRGVLAPFAHDGPVRRAPGIQQFYRSDHPMTPERWAAERGLLFERDWSQAEMPREVALALRGPSWHAPFTPVPPELTTARGDADAVDQEAGTVAGHVLERALALLDQAARTPVAVLKTGGVGQREVKRLAKDLQCSAEEVRVLLEVLYAAGLLPESTDGHLPHPYAGQWTAAPGGARLARLLDAWWRIERSPLRRDEDNWPPVLAGPAKDGEVAVAVRRAALTVLAELPDGTGAADIAAAVEWRCPLYPPELVAEFLTAALAEARLLGLVAGEAASRLGRALVGGDPTPAAERMLTVARQEALFGADLTAVVTGPPTADLARLLDQVAEREARGTASVWRFNPVSVRRALDDGLTADEVLAALGKVSSTGLPQPLVYLVTDMARRHGEVAVTEVVSVVRADDEALLREIAGHRRLRKLALRAIAPTVLASTVPAADTLAALREAGYAPVPATLDGVPTIARTVLAGGSAAHPTGPAETNPAEPRSHFAVDLDTLAHHLLGTADRARMSDEQVRAAIRRHCNHVQFGTQFALEYLVRFGHPKRVEAATEDGTTGVWTLSHGELDGDVLDAWCTETAGYQRLPLSSITRVS
jgi:hypothetical protein